MNKLGRVHIALYMAAIFLAGGVSGASITSRFGRHSNSSPPTAKRLQFRLQRQLELSPEQLRQIQPVVERMAADFKSVQAASVHQMAGVISNRYEELGKFLTPDQRAKLKKIESDRLDRLNRSCR